MSNTNNKEFLESLFSNLSSNTYTWKLYFFYRKKPGNSTENPFRVKKAIFRKDALLTDYIDQLMICIKKFQIDKIESIEEYNGTNSKISCDTLNLESPLISDNWLHLVQTMAHLCEPELERVTGYILDGSPMNSRQKSITLIKKGNPSTTYKNSKSVIAFSKNTGILEDLNDDICRLYLNVDCFRYGDTLYTFNHQFEDIFGIPKPLHLKKQYAIKDIASSNAFAEENIEEIIKRSVTEKKLFMTFNVDRLNKLSNLEERTEIANLLSLPLNSNGVFENLDKEKLKLLTRYLCNQVFKDDESKELYLVNGMSKLLNDSE